MRLSSQNARLTGRRRRNEHEAGNQADGARAEFADHARDVPTGRLERLAPLVVSQRRSIGRNQATESFDSFESFFFSFGKTFTFSSFVPSGSTMVATPPDRSALRLTQAWTFHFFPSADFVLRTKGR